MNYGADRTGRRSVPVLGSRVAVAAGKKLGPLVWPKEADWTRASWNAGLGPEMV